MAGIDTTKILAHAHHLLMNEATILQGQIENRFYSKQTKNSLGVRTGQARRGWKVLKQGDKAVAIINDVEHADHSERKVIRPKKAKYLAIPVGPALTNAGVARYSGPRDSACPDLRVAGSVANDNLVLLGKKKGNKKKEHIFFVLKKKVVIPARTKGLQPFVKKRGGVLKTRIAKEMTRYMDALETEFGGDRI